MPIAPLGLKLLNMEHVQDFSKQLGKSEGMDKGKFDSLLRAAGEPKENAVPKIESPEIIRTPMQIIVGSIAKSENRLNNLVALGLSGQQFSNQQLLSIQAGVYKATLTIDVVSKGVEQTTSGLKTLLQSQV